MRNELKRLQALLMVLMFLGGLGVSSCTTVETRSETGICGGLYPSSGDALNWFWEIGGDVVQVPGGPVILVLLFPCWVMDAAVAVTTDTLLLPADLVGTQL